MRPSRLRLIGNGRTPGAAAIRAELGTDTPVDLPGATKTHSRDSGRVVIEVEDRVVSTVFEGDTATAIALANLVLTPSRWADEYRPTPRSSRASPRTLAQ